MTRGRRPTPAESSLNAAASKVAFRYAKNDKGKWILNTSYPTTNDSCQ
jgi:hypothetical protein